MRIFTKKIYLFLVLSILFTASCAHVPRNNPNNPIRKVAVLPMVNNTTDMDGPEIVRKGFYKLVRNRYYEVSPLAETDQILRDKMGISLGGQLGLTEAKTLGETIIQPKSSHKGLLFIPTESFTPGFELILLERESKKTLEFTVAAK